MTARAEPCCCRRQERRRMPFRVPQSGTSRQEQALLSIVKAFHLNQPLYFRIFPQQLSVKLLLPYILPNTKFFSTYFAYLKLRFEPRGKAVGGGCCPNVPSAQPAAACFCAFFGVLRRLSAHFDDLKNPFKSMNQIKIYDALLSWFV